MWSICSSSNPCNCHLYPQKGVPSTPLLTALAIIFAAGATLAILAFTTSYLPSYMQWVGVGMAAFACAAMCATIYHARTTKNPTASSSTKEDEEDLSFKNIAPYIPQNHTTPPSSLTQKEAQEKLKAHNIRMHVHHLEKVINDTKENKDTKAERSETKKDLRLVNQQIFATVKAKRPAIQTPLDFLWSLNGENYALQAPIAIGDGALFVLEENAFYIEAFGSDTPGFKKPEHDAQQIVTHNPFGWALKRAGPHLDLYLDGISNGVSIMINGTIYPYLYGRGADECSYRLKEGDVVCRTGCLSSHIFTVGPYGSLILPPQKRHELERDAEALQQSVDFEQQLSLKRLNSLNYTANAQAAEIGFAPLNPGFSVYSSVYIANDHSVKDLDHTHTNEKGDLIFVDMQQDKVLQQLVEYLKVEFEVMQYTEEEKMTRLTLLASDLFSEEVYDYKMSYNYLLGEILRAGRGVCRHRALLIKALSDALGLKCALINSIVSTPIPFFAGSEILGFAQALNSSAHAWNVMEIEGHYWIVDAMHECVFRVDQPPGQSPENRKQISTWYGIAGSGIDPRTSSL